MQRHLHPGIRNDENALALDRHGLALDRHDNVGRLVVEELVEEDRSDAGEMNGGGNRNDYARLESQSGSLNNINEYGQGMEDEDSGRGTHAEGAQFDNREVGSFHGDGTARSEECMDMWRQTSSEMRQSVGEEKSDMTIGKMKCDYTRKGNYDDAMDEANNELAGQGLVNWLNLPEGTLLYLFDKILNQKEEKEAVNRNTLTSISQVCKLWREAAIEVIMRDTAGSKPRQPRFPIDSGTKTSCAVITNNEPSSSLKDDLSSKPRKAPLLNVEHKGAKRRRTGNDSKHNGRSRHEEDRETSDASVDATNHAGAVAGNEDDDDEEVTADFRGRDDRNNEGDDAQGLHDDINPSRANNLGAAYETMPMYIPQNDGRRISFGNLFQFGRRVDPAHSPGNEPVNQPHQIGQGLGRPVATTSGPFFNQENDIVPGIPQGPIAMTTSQIRNVQMRTFNLLLDFWAGRRGEEMPESRKRGTTIQNHVNNELYNLPGFTVLPESGNQTGNDSIYQANDVEEELPAQTRDDRTIERTGDAKKL